MRNWLLSTIAIVAILGIGIAGYMFLSSFIPSQLVVTSAFLSEGEKDEPAKIEASEKLDTKTVIHNTQKLVVMIDSPTTFSTGSGFLYNDQGDIITNAHVVAGSEKVKVRMTDASEYEGTVIGISSEIDVAVVRVPDLEGITPLPIAVDRTGEIGDEILALGSPLGLQNTVTTGIISGVDRSFEIFPFQYENVYQISAPIAPGNSGGPLVDLNTGEVLGINSASMDEGVIGFSIPITHVLSIVKQWSETPMTSLPDIYGEDLDWDYSDVQYDDYSEVDMATYLIDYFYENINYNDYVTAYSMLGYEWQTKTSYNTFRDGYLNTRYVTIDDIQAWQEEETISVIVYTSVDENINGSDVVSNYKATYIVGYENDQLKLISGSGEKLN